MPILIEDFATGLWSGDTELSLPGTGLSQPPGLEAVLEYNGMIFHDRAVVDKYRILKIDGLQDPDVRDNREVNPSAHGETALASFYGGRTILLTGRIEAYTTAKLRDMQQGLRTAFSSLIEKPLIFHVGDINKEIQIMCRKIDKISMTEEQTNDKNVWRDFQITLRASDPRFISRNVRQYNQTFGIIDDNSSGAITQWTVASGTAPSVTASALVVPASAVQIYERNDIGYNPIDHQITTKITTPATVTTNDTVGAVLKEIDSSNFVYARLLAASSTTGKIEVYKVVSGSATSLASTSTFTIAAATNYWLQASISGNLITAKMFTTDPNPGPGTPLGSTSTYTLASTDATNFGLNVKGKVGLRIQSASGQSYKLDDFRFEPLQFNDVLSFKPNNQGNWNASTIIRFYGPASNVTLTNNTNLVDETSARVMKINGAIPAGDYFEYNSAAGTLKNSSGVSKLGSLDISSKAIMITQGENTLSLQLASSSGITPAITVNMYDTWL